MPLASEWTQQYSTQLNSTQTRLIPPLSLFPSFPLSLFPSSPLSPFSSLALPPSPSLAPPFLFFALLFLLLLPLITAYSGPPRQTPAASVKPHLPVPTLAASAPPKAKGKLSRTFSEPLPRPLRTHCLEACKTLPTPLAPPSHSKVLRLGRRLPRPTPSGVLQA